MVILDDRVPVGIPREPPQVHAKALADFAESDDFQVLTPSQQELFGQWIQQVMELVNAENERAGMAQAAEQGGQQGQGGGGEEGSVDTGQAPVQENELTDETLPSAGGGSA